MASDTSQDVYTGFWINWTGGSIAGSTLTLNNRDGAYLVAFLALLVRIAGNHFWKLLCYVAFHTFPIPKDATPKISWRQQRAVLRNSYSAMDAATRFGRIALGSKRRAERMPRGPFVLLTTALLNVIGFFIAGIFSSAVTRTESAVLLQPSNCGRWLDVSTAAATEWNTRTVIRSIDLLSVGRSAQPPGKFALSSNLRRSIEPIRVLQSLRGKNNRI